MRAAAFAVAFATVIPALALAAGGDDDGMEVKGGLGTVDAEQVEAALAGETRAVQACYQQGLEHFVLTRRNVSQLFRCQGVPTGG